MLTVIAIRPLLSPSPSNAQRSLQYKVSLFSAPVNEQRMEVKLNELGRQGWDTASEFGGGNVLIMKK
jgi:hypothetical protein